MKLKNFILIGLMLLCFNPIAFALTRSETINNKIDVQADYIKRGLAFSNLITFLNANLDKKYDLFFNADVALDASVSVPTNAVTIEFSREGEITLGNFDITLTNSTIIYAGEDHKCFDYTGTGRVLGTISNSTLYTHWFGAKGDNSTDDKNAIDYAIDVSPAKGTVKFKSGSTYITSGCTVDNSVTLDLNGATLKLKASSTAQLLDIVSGNVTVKNGTLDGNKANQSNSAAYTIKIDASDDVTIKDLKINDSYFYAILAEDSEDLKIIRNEITDSLYISIFVRPTTGADVKNVTIQDNIVDRSSIAAGSIVEGAIKIRGDTSSLNLIGADIINNKVYMPTNPTDGTSICIEAFGLAPYSKIIGNYTSGGSMGISLANSDKSTIIGNEIFNADLYGIEVAQTSDHVAVVGNIIDGNSLTGDLISVSGTSNYTIINGNQCFAPTDDALQLTLCDYAIINGNYFENVNGYCLNITNSSDYAIIANNHIIGDGVNSTKGIILDSSNSAKINNNVIKDFTENGILLFSSTLTFTDINIHGNTFENVNVAFNKQLSGSGALGAEIMFHHNINGIRDYEDYANNIQVRYGTGDPTGNVTAGVGSTFYRTNGGSGTVLYVKESGTDATGWVAK